jgi:hypothetical protein
VAGSRRGISETNFPAEVLARGLRSRSLVQSPRDGGLRETRCADRQKPRSPAPLPLLVPHNVHSDIGDKRELAFQTRTFSVALSTVPTFPAALPAAFVNPRYRRSSNFPIRLSLPQVRYSNSQRCARFAPAAGGGEGDCARRLARIKGRRQMRRF